MSINLGKEPSSDAIAVKPSEPSKPFYPSLYIDDVPGLHTLPESGTMTVRFKRRSVTVSKYGDAAHKSSVSLDIISIEKVTPDQKARKSGVDAFDETAAAVMKKHMEPDADDKGGKSDNDEDNA